MIDKNLSIKTDNRRGDRDKNLIAKLNKYTKEFRVGYDQGGPVKPKPPFELSEVMALGLQIANMTDTERKNLQFMLDKIGPKKKWKNLELTQTH